jgi:outer membrane protein OmpA-like peptidoglycan-associated protein
MTGQNASRVVLIALLLAVAACSKEESVAKESPMTSAATQKEPARTACAMVTAAEMSGIVGAAVVAEGEDGEGTTTCRYKPAERSLPYIELKVDWGNGAVAMTSAGILSRLEPGIADRLSGLGDQASAIGPALMIRTGDDLVNLTLMGVDDNVASARRIIALLRPRMGPSAQATASGAGDSGSDEAAKAGALVSSLLDGLADQNDRETNHGGRAGGHTDGVPDEAVFAAATGPSIRIPLVAGLTLVAAEHEPGRGDYEPIVTVRKVTSDGVSTVFSANLPEGTRVDIDRVVRREDLRQARGFRSWYEEADPKTFAGATSFSVSTAVLTDLKTKGHADVVRMNANASPLAAIASVVAGNANVAEHPGSLKRVEPHAVAFPVLLNDEPVTLHAIHARGTFDDGTIDFHLLDDPDNPILLRVAGGSTGRIVRITFPAPGATAIEEKLKKGSRVELHGIYFDFGKATIRPESEPVLREIAAALLHNPAWTINVEGHTDNVGDDATNLDLSRRRADAVKQALVERHRVVASNLTTAGFGASRPADSNDTLSGRARNRRVELVRQ